VTVWPDTGAAKWLDGKTMEHGSLENTVTGHALVFGGIGAWNSVQIEQLVPED